MTARKWIPIIVGIVIFVILVGAGLVGALVYMVTRQVDVQSMSTAGGQEEFEKLLESKAGQLALIELPAYGSDDEVVVHRHLIKGDTGSVSVMRVRVWSPRDKTFVKIDLPFWMMRLTGNKPITLNAGSLRRVTLTVTPEDIDRRGPGLLLNWSGRKGERLLVWTE